jgi:hypothetical protein
MYIIIIINMEGERVGIEDNDCKLNPQALDQKGTLIFSIEHTDKAPIVLIKK